MRPFQLEGQMNKKWTKEVFMHVRFSGDVTNAEKCRGLKAKRFLMHNIYVKIDFYNTMVLQHLGFQGKACPLSPPAIHRCKK